MRLSEVEESMLAGEQGESRKWAMEHLIAVGSVFDAADFVAVSQAHMMADTESFGEANGWTHILRNSMKIVNFIAGYDYRLALRNMEQCLDSAIAEEIA